MMVREAVDPGPPARERTGLREVLVTPGARPEEPRGFVLADGFAVVVDMVLPAVTGSYVSISNPFQGPCIIEELVFFGEGESASLVRGLQVYLSQDSVLPGALPVDQLEMINTNLGLLLWGRTLSTTGAHFRSAIPLGSLPGSGPRVKLFHSVGFGTWFLKLYVSIGNIVATAIGCVATCRRLAPGSEGVGGFEIPSPGPIGEPGATPASAAEPEAIAFPPPQCDSRFIFLFSLNGDTWLWDRVTGEFDIRPSREVTANLLRTVVPLLEITAPNPPEIRIAA